MEKFWVQESVRLLTQPVRIAYLSLLLSKKPAKTADKHFRHEEIITIDLICLLQVVYKGNKLLLYCSTLKRECCRKKVHDAGIPTSTK